MQKTIIGRWQGTHEIDEFLTDGTFVFSVANETGQQQTVSGKYNFLDATTLQLSLGGSDKKIVFTDFNIKDETMSLKSKDGKNSLYHRIATAEGVKPNAETGRLKNAIVGKWQSSGKSEIDEWSDDGRMVINTTQGRTIACRYEVIDWSHVKVIAEGAKDSSAAIWRVSINGDTMTVDATAAKGPAVVTFTRMKSNLAMASPMPSVERQLSPRPSPIQPRQRPSKPEREAGQQKVAEFRRAILGKWQVPGKKEMNEWLDDGTAVSTNGAGEKLECTYKAVGANGVLMIPDGSSPLTSPRWLVEIDGDLMALTTPTADGPVTEYMVRLNAKGEPAAVAVPTPDRPVAVDRSAVIGNWKTDGEPMILSQDGTFVLGEAKGQWQMDGGKMIAHGTQGTIWKLSLSPDGHTLSGYWSAHGRASLTGKIAFTR
jgi:hypothetical protein